jgi:hypothetical protein
MDTKRIIANIDTEISKLQQVRGILIGIELQRGAGRPILTVPKVTETKTRRMSWKGRAARSAAMTAYWAKKRKASKT